LQAVLHAYLQAEDAGQAPHRAELLRQHPEFAAELAAWLRQLLACTLADALRDFARAKRDVNRECSLEAAIEQSSGRLASLLGTDQASPSQQAVRHEEAIRVANALAQLLEAQRQAVELRYWQGMSLAEISAQLGRSTTAVAGLLKRGLEQLRHLLQEERGT
jgi:RNA polymerase sigma-70 factor (ECF subfamily)